ncbi:MAG: caspase family protein [Nitrosopumilus sp.]|nr:caspase family protein [Nitrosopumilus sp.]
MESDGKRKALIISISDYNDESLPNLDFCKNDGEEMYQTLTKLGYEILENQKIVGKSDHKTIQDTIISFFRKEANRDDTLLFYFSGHGVLDGYGGRFFSTTEIDTSIPEQDGVRFELLNEQMARSIAEKKIAILDCCFSGGAVPDILGKSGDDMEKEAEDLGSESLHKVFNKSQGSCILASSLSNKRSFSLEDESASAFTHFIIDGLKGTKNSVDENGFVTPEKLSTYVYSEMQKIPGLANQKPVRNLSISGTLILAEHPHLLLSKSTKDNAKIGKLQDRLVTTGKKLKEYESELEQIKKDEFEPIIEIVEIIDWSIQGGSATQKGSYGLIKSDKGMGMSYGFIFITEKNLHVVHTRKKKGLQDFLKILKFDESIIHKILVSSNFTNDLKELLENIPIKEIIAAGDANYIIPRNRIDQIQVSSKFSRWRTNRLTVLIDGDKLNRFAFSFLHGGRNKEKYNTMRDSFQEIFSEKLILK